MQLAKAYMPGDFEPTIYALWEQRDAFKPTEKGDPFSVVMPPPNANAGLHIGHILHFAITDSLARYWRMNGKDVAWIPGADHAGFETQVVYEKHLAKEGKSRFDFSREELYDQIFTFVEGNREAFFGLFRELGASCDWSRFTFTLDDKVVKTAYGTFKKLWEDGLIYRGERLVNYCTQHRTGFADIEVVYEDRTTPLYYLQYGPFELATTRPETKFGDTAVAVHPNDERYKQYVGKVLQIEGLNGPFELRVVADEYVDPNFGTGVVKITPAHDFNDWEVAQRHSLPAVRVINHDGTMNHLAGEFAGMPVVEARAAVVKALKEKGLLIRVDKDYKNRVGVCYKCGTVIEPMLLDQWFIDMKKLAAPAIEALKKDKVTFYPSQKKEQVIQYLENVRDWNISRQIAWGIPIPAFQNVNDSDEWIFDERVDQEIIERDGKTYRRDPDVFDTWFSSGQWPFVCTNYPDSSDFRRYYPNSLMETGVDILYQWVSRMLCMGLYVTGDIPFKDVYLHGMVRSEDGRKMSKSLGNVVDPVPLLKEYGADAVRVGMMSGRSAGESAAFAPARIIAGRNFCNKLWNIARFVEYSLDGAAVQPSAKPKTIADHWLLRNLQQTLSTVSDHLAAYRMSEAYDTVYHFIWDDIADWYVEASKYEKQPEMLAYVLDTALRLAHPFTPFVSEAIWQTLPWTGDSLLIAADWPKPVPFDTKLAEQFEEIKKIVTETRTIMTEMKISKTSLYYTDVPFLSEHATLIAGLARLDGVHEVEDGKGLHLTQTAHRAWLDVDRQTIDRYRLQLKKLLTEAENSREGLEKRLGNESYTKKAPKELVEESRAQLAACNEQIVKLQHEIERFA